MFECGERKNVANVEKHGVSFETASRIFEGPVLTAVDDRFDYGEVWRGPGEQYRRDRRHLFLTVTHTERAGATRIISARRAKQSERGRYDQAIQKGIDP